MTLILSNDEIDNLLSMSECIATLEEAYVELAEGRGVNRTRSDCFTLAAGRPEALYSLKSMDGVIPKLGVGAVRINSDIVTWPERGGTQVRAKVPAADGRYVGLVLLFSCETGAPLMIAPDGVMQRMRVGATNGLGAKYMAREDARTVAVLGSGWQAGAQLMAICAVRRIERIRCYSPTGQNRVRFAQEMTQRLGREVEPVAKPEQALKGADVVLCATNAIQPVFFEEWITPGVHLSSIKLPEMHPGVLRRADRLAVHTFDTTPLHFTTKDLVVAEKAEGKGWSAKDEFDLSSAPTLPDLITGRYQGRTRPEEVTCFLNNLGMGYQFAAVGALTYRNAKERGVGRELPTEWFTEDVHP